ncbi:unnamed protein product [Peronospora belbahrii]|uniref:Integrator complex subunit 4/Protein SIEL C-terminal Ig-like domain-containing protein n=1 Tax=Peronospora belbahrii TaxID=622444 RepID=A0ABN8CPD6_9STRA|nr:unnamed protein product [Peronospora belbahrii]
MSSIIKRERELEVSSSGGNSVEVAIEKDSKRLCIRSTKLDSSSAVSFVSHRPLLTSVEGFQALHPMAVLDAIRTKLQSTSDPHLQARLLLQYSSAAVSPEAMTAAAIDFLFSFLQQNQTQSETLNDGNQTSKDVGNRGAIVVGAIVRGLRQLLAVKALVVEPMIQVDAMGEQLMQCISVSEDFKLRRDMMRIVLDCLMFTKKYTQVETLLHTCVQDHDMGMQTICLRGYLRLHDAGQNFAVAEMASNSKNIVTKHFDRFTAFVLFAQSDEVKVLAAQVLVALANRYSQHAVASCKYFPSSTSCDTVTKPLLLPEKTFYMLCIAGYDTEKSVRAEVARCLRRFSRALTSEVVEHAVIKTQIDEAVVDVLPDVVEMNTRYMMSSGVLLSLLEDIDMDVAAEASRTIARLSEMTLIPNAGAGQWSQRALERAITAHFDILPHARMASAAHLCRVLVNTLGRLLVCRHRVNTTTEFTISSADMSCLVRCAFLSADSSGSAVIGILFVFQYCDLSSVWAVQRLVDFVLEVAASPLFDHGDVNDEDTDYWNEQLLVMVQILGQKCAKVLQVDVALSDRLEREASTQRIGKRRFLERVCQALLGHTGLEHAKTSAVSDKPKPPSDGSSLFFLNHSSPSETFSRSSENSYTVSAGVVSAMTTLRKPPLDVTVAVYLKAIHRLRRALAADDLDVSLRIADTLVRLRQHVQLFPDASTTLVPVVHKYVSMQAMLNTSPSVSCGHTNNSSRGGQDQNEAIAFTHLRLPTDLQKGCQEMVDVASCLYVKAFALTLLPRMELLQLVMLGRVGLVLTLLQNSINSPQTTKILRWIVKEATRLRFLVSDKQCQDDVWLPVQSLAKVCSLNELKRIFVATVRKAWPVNLIGSVMSRCTSSTGSASGRRYQHMAIAFASIQEPASTKPDPREVTANWPFEQRVRFLLTNVRDVTQVYIKSVFPNGNVAHHHVPASCIRHRGPRKHSVEHTIRLTVSPFSDPTEFLVAVCLGHPTLPGSVKQNAHKPDEANPQMFIEISACVGVSIFQRTSYTSKQARSSTAP